MTSEVVPATIRGMEMLEKEILSAIKLQINSFRIFRGEHPRLDLLLTNLDAIIAKYESRSKAERISAGATSVVENLDEDIDVLTKASTSTFSCLTSIGSSSDERKRKLSLTALCNDQIGVGKKHREDDESSDEANADVQSDIVQSDDEDESERDVQSDNVQSDDEDEMDDDEDEIQILIDHEIFTVDVVMLKVMSYLSNQEVMICREVNSEFKFYADQVIAKRQCTTVRFKYDWTADRYVSMKFPLNRDANYTLSAFLRLIFTRSNFPCTDFRFYSGALNCPYLQMFLSEVGNQIKQLTLDVYCQRSNQIRIQNRPASVIQNYPTTDFLKKLLVHQAPCLQALHLKHCPENWNSNQTARLFTGSEVDELALPNMQEIICDQSVPDWVFTDLLKVCPNLAAVPLEKFVPTLRENKFHLLLALAIIPHEELLVLCEKILPNAKSQLRVFGCGPLKSVQDLELLPRLSAVIGHVLQASCATLEKLNLHLPMNALPNIKIPTIPNLKSLEICMNRNDISVLERVSKIMLPLGFQFKSFPNIVQIGFDIDCYNLSEAWESYFENYLPVLSVRALDIRGSKLPSGWMLKFATIFPNLQKMIVRVTFFDILDAARSGLWTFEKLRVLDMEISADPLINFFYRLDTAFTGFSHSTCSDLKISSHKIGISKVGELREFPSILNLKNLARLHLTFTDTFQQLRSTYYPLVTNLTGLFAFRMCPQLNVKFSGKLKNIQNAQALRIALSTVGEYVGDKTDFDLKLMPIHPI